MRGFVSFFGAVSRLVWDVQSTILRLLDLVFPPIELVTDLHVSMSFDQLLHIFSEGIDGR